MKYQKVSSVIEQLRELIVTGELSPGEELLEVPTAARLGISRTPLRPALAALAQEGLLQVRGARGYIVRKQSLSEVVDAYLVRAHLEGLACFLVAQRGIDADEQARFAAILRQGDRILAEGDTYDEQRRNAWREMNESFHNLILERSGNLCLVDTTSRTLAQPLLSSRVAHFESHSALTRSHDDHWTILRALEVRNPVRAQSVMMEHIFRSADILKARFETSLATLDDTEQH